MQRIDHHEVWEAIHSSSSGDAARMEGQVLVIQRIEDAAEADTKAWECGG